MAAGDVARASKRDGIHLEPADHEKLGRAIAEQVSRILGA
jgi:ABC-type sugar transport system substrate-binding protein